MTLSGPTPPGFWPTPPSVTAKHHSLAPIRAPRRSTGDPLIPDGFRFWPGIKPASPLQPRSLPPGPGRAGRETKSKKNKKTFLVAEFSGEQPDLLRTALRAASTGLRPARPTAPTTTNKKIEIFSIVFKIFLLRKFSCPLIPRGLVRPPAGGAENSMNLAIIDRLGTAPRPSPPRWAPRYGNFALNAGSRRARVRCSKSAASASRRASLHARPKNKNPTGTPSFSSKGTVTLG